MYYIRMTLSICLLRVWWVAFYAVPLKETKFCDNDLLANPIMEALHLWREHMLCRGEEDWIFAIGSFTARRPTRTRSSFANTLAGDRANLWAQEQQGRSYWLAPLRRSLATLLISNG